jgi:hypothetical protein
MKKLLLVLMLLMPMMASANSTCDGMWIEHHAIWEADQQQCRNLKVIFLHCRTVAYVTRQ